MKEDRIGKFIQKIRKEKQLTQKEFADQYHVSFQAVSKWENGKNIPDITILKQICKDNNISIDELLENDVISTNKKNRKKTIIVVILILVLIIIFMSILLLNIYRNKDSHFEFKKISTTCAAFKITGSAAYNQDKSSLYISNIEFCGEEDTVYKKIEYILFESHNNTNVKISTGEVNQNTTLIEYLSDLKINVNDYSQTCKYFAHSDLYIEINATDLNDKITTYQIPILLEENCE